MGPVLLAVKKVGQITAATVVGQLKPQSMNLWQWNVQVETFSVIVVSFEVVSTMHNIMLAKSVEQAAI